jgi:hypothetical protein
MYNINCIAMVVRSNCLINFFIKCNIFSLKTLVKERCGEVRPIEHPLPLKVKKK